MRVRVSIRGIMALVVLVAVILAAWLGGTPLWANVVFNLTVLGLLYASYEARYSRGASGAWWFGFALCGWASLVLSLATVSVNHPESYLRTPTDALLLKAVEFRGRELLGGSPRAWVTARSRYFLLKVLLAFPNALLGGALVRYFAMRRQRGWDEGRSQV